MDLLIVLHAEIIFSIHVAVLFLFLFLSLLFFFHVYFSQHAKISFGTFGKIFHEQNSSTGGS